MTRALTFAKDHIKPIKDKEKRLTIRYDYNADHRQGDSIKFMDPDHLLFGSAVVLQFYTMTVKAVVNIEWEYHRNYRNIKQLQTEFGEYYPDAEFEPETELTVIEWNRTFTPNWEYFQT